MKKYMFVIVIVLISFCMLYIYDTSRTLTLNDYFEDNIDYTSDWNNTTKNINVKKEFPLKFNQTYKNITTQVNFYKDSRLLKSVSVINSTNESKLIVCASTKLSEEPNNIEFDIVEGDLIESDIEGAEYGENFHLFK